MSNGTKKSGIPQTIEIAKKQRLIFLGVFAVSTLLFIIIPLTGLLGDLGFLIALPAFFVSLYTGAGVYMGGKVIKSFKDTTCDNCNTRLVYNDKTKVDVLKKWRTTNQNSSNGDILAKTMFRVSVENTCPSCRRKKTFETTLATDKIRVTGDLSSIKSEVDEANLEDVVKAYFGQSIRR
jgi:hypothetical protein